MKTCRKCGKTLPVDEFYRHKRMRDGRFNHCRSCMCEAAKKNRKRNREHYLDYDYARAMRHDRVEQRRQYSRSPRSKIRRHQRTHGTGSEQCSANSQS